jgi:hypothetical protein
MNAHTVDMTFLEQMHDSFRGERIEALFFIAPAAVVLFILAAVAVKSEGGAFGIAMAVPLVVFGLVAFGTGLAVGLRTPSQVAALEQAYAASPGAMVAEELPRMRKVNTAWPVYLGTWTVLVLAGLVLRFLVKSRRGSEDAFPDATPRQGAQVRSRNSESPSRTTVNVRRPRVAGP